MKFNNRYQNQTEKTKIYDFFFSAKLNEIKSETLEINIELFFFFFQSFAFEKFTGIEGLTGGERYSEKLNEREREKRRSSEIGKIERKEMAQNAQLRLCFFL